MAEHIMCKLFAQRIYKIYIQVTKVKKYRLLQAKCCKGCDGQIGETQAGTSKSKLTNTHSSWL